jgi:hypothetical protein
MGIGSSPGQQTNSVLPPASGVRSHGVLMEPLIIGARLGDKLPLLAMLGLPQSAYVRFKKCCP